MTRRTALFSLAAADVKPLACDMKALTAAQRTEHSKRTKQLFAAARERKELKDGFAFRIDLAASPLDETARWIDLERLCCPFLRFGLEVDSGVSWLRLTGPRGVKEFLRKELPLN